MASTQDTTTTSNTDAPTHLVELSATVASIVRKPTDEDGTIIKVTMERPSGEERKTSQSARFRRASGARPAGGRASGERFLFTVGGEEGEAMVKGVKKGDQRVVTASIYESNHFRTLLNLSGVAKVSPGDEPVNRVKLLGQLVESNEQGDLLNRIRLGSGGSLYSMVVEQDGLCYAVMLRGVKAKKLADGYKLGDEVEIEGRLYSHKAGSKTVLNIDVTAINRVGEESSEQQ